MGIEEKKFKRWECGDKEIKNFPGKTTTAIKQWSEAIKSDPLRGEIAIRIEALSG